MISLCSAKVCFESPVNTGMIHAVFAQFKLKTHLKGKNMPAVKVKDNEPFDIALRRFKRSCEKAGVLAEVRRRECYEKPTTLRKRAAAAAVKRHAKKVSREQKKFQRLY